MIYTAVYMRAEARWKPILFQKEREWINFTLFVFEHDGNLWRGVRPTPTLSRSRWLQHDAKIRPRQILRGSKRKKREGWKDEVKRHENSSRERSMWRKRHRSDALVRNPLSSSSTRKVSILSG